MKEIKITMKDGTVKRFEHRGRVGGSYTIGIRYEGNFAIVEDEWGDTKAFPAADIAQIETQEFRSW